MPNPNLASLVQTEMAVSLLGRLVRSSGILMDAVNNWNSLVTELQSAGEAYHFPVPLRQVRLQPDIEEVEWEENPPRPGDTKGKGNALRRKEKKKKGKRAAEGSPDPGPPSPRSGDKNDDDKGGGSGGGTEWEGIGA